MMTYRCSYNHQKTIGLAENTAPYIAKRVTEKSVLLLDTHSTEYIWKACIRISLHNGDNEMV